jgi:hypothetical protein
LSRQQRANLHCLTITRGFPKLLPRHSFPRVPVFRFFYFFKEREPSF